MAWFKLTGILRGSWTIAEGLSPIYMVKSPAVDLVTGTQSHEPHPPEHRHER